jgi:hypothetical protein
MCALSTFAHTSARKDNDSANRFPHECVLSQIDDWLEMQQRRLCWLGNFAQPCRVSDRRLVCNGTARGFCVELAGLCASFCRKPVAGLSGATLQHAGFKGVGASESLRRMAACRQTHGLVKFRGSVDRLGTRRQPYLNSSVLRMLPRSLIQKCCDMVSCLANGKSASALLLSTFALHIRDDVDALSMLRCPVMLVAPEA